MTIKSSNRENQVQKILKANVLPLQLSLVSDLNGRLVFAALDTDGVDRVFKVDFWPLRLELLPVRCERPLSRCFRRFRIRFFSLFVAFIDSSQ